MRGLLDVNDRTSETWGKIRKLYTERLEMLRTRNDSVKLSMHETDFLRGQIAECKAVLALEKQLPPHEPDNPPDGA